MNIFRKSYKVYNEDLFHHLQCTKWINGLKVVVLFSEWIFKTLNMTVMSLLDLYVQLSSSKLKMLFCIPWITATSKMLTCQPLPRPSSGELVFTGKSDTFDSIGDFIRKKMYISADRFDFFLRLSFMLFHCRAPDVAAAGSTPHQNTEEYQLQSMDITFS